VERKRNPGLTVHKSQLDHKNQQERSAFQKGDIRKWLVPNELVHKGNAIACKHFFVAWLLEEAGNEVTIAVKAQVRRYEGKPGLCSLARAGGDVKQAAGVANNGTVAIATQGCKE
jgi:hypothetical protein